MRVAGFTFIRNAVRYDYPIVEAIRSILPLCDLVIVAVGQSEDGTLELIQGIGDPKIKILETVWDDRLREGGRVLAVETDKAFQAIPADYDWCIYIQGDEAMHEQDHALLRQQMEAHLHNPTIEGLLLNYHHFYGSYDYIGSSRRWYRKEIRIIKNKKTIFSYKDAQGFRLRLPNQKSRKLQVKPVNAWIYHYGWVKHPAHQLNKQQNFNKLWHPDDWVQDRFGQQEEYQYDGSEPLRRFEGSHPAVMQPRIQAVNWQFNSDPSRMRRSWKDRISDWLERTTGWRPGEYKNYTQK